MTGVTRRRFLGAAVATVPLAGCTAGEEQEDLPQADIISERDDEGTAPIESVRTVKYDPDNGLFAAELLLEVELVDYHGYGKIVAEYRDYSEEYVKTMRTVTLDKDVYELVIEGEPKYINLTADCDTTEKIEAVVEVKPTEGQTDE